MAKDQALPPAMRRNPPPTRQSAQAVAERAEDHAPKKRFNPVVFAREVRAEWKKVTWPSWRETWITSIMVAVMVVVTALFFFVVDWALSTGVGALLKVGGA